MPSTLLASSLVRRSIPAAAPLLGPAAPVVTTIITVYSVIKVVNAVTGQLNKSNGIREINITKDHLNVFFNAPL